jgi:predicted nuclease of predicted toxin-antitoxin system
VSLRFFSDQCVPSEVTDALRHGGHEVILLREVLPVRALDSLVIAKAQELGALLLSLNSDFADIVAYPPTSYLGIVALQLHNHPEIIPDLMERLLAFLDAHTDLKLASTWDTRSGRRRSWRVRLASTTG